MATNSDELITACVVIIGNEILSGRTKDANLTFLAGRLDEMGIRLREARVVPDDGEAIVETLNEVRARYDYVFTTGGIGPTHDDITAECVARAFGVRLIENPEARAILAAGYGPGELNEARLRMANTPEGAQLILNPISRAPGFQFGNVFVLAGVPSVARAMFESLKERLTGGTPLVTHSLEAQIPEGRLAGPLRTLQDDYPEIEMGSYPFHEKGVFGARLVLRGTDPVLVKQAAERLEALVDGLGET